MKQEAQAIIHRYFLSPAESITEVRQGTAGILVCAGSQTWMVRPIEHGKNFSKSAGYVLYDIEPDIGSRLQGVAVLPDGRTFHLNHETELGQFFTAAHTLLKPLELASLLAFYQSHAEGNESVIAQPEDLSDLLDPAQVEALTKFCFPQVNQFEEDRVRLVFCTRFLGQEPPDYLFKVNLNRWEATIHENHLDWFVQPIVCGLISLRYLPR